MRPTPPLMSRSTSSAGRRSPTAGREAADRPGDSGVEGATADDDAVDHLAQRAGGDGRHALTSTEVAVALAVGRGRTHPRHARRRRGGRRRQGRPLCKRTGTTTSSAPSSRASVALTRMPPSTGSPACWRRAKIRVIARRLVDSRLRRHRARRSSGAPDRDGGGAGGRVRWAPGGAAQPGARGDPPCDPHRGRTGVTRAIFAARPQPRRRRNGVRCRPTCADGHYKGAESLGHGVGYRYPHDEASGWA